MCTKSCRASVIFMKIGPVKLILLMGERNLYPYLTFFMVNLGKIMRLKLTKFHENRWGELRILLSREFRVG